MNTAQRVGLISFEEASSTVRYDFDGNLECPTEDDSADVDSREGDFNDFLRNGVECAAGQGVFSSDTWPTSDVKVDSAYVGFWGETPGDAPFSFGEGSQISFTVSRSSAGPKGGELSYIRDADVPSSVGTWTLDETETQDVSYSLSQIGIAARIEFQFHGWAATSDSGALQIDNIVLTFAIASSVEDKPELPNEFIMSAAYPNPFKSATMLPLVIETSSNVRVEILDVLGRCLKVQYDGPLARGQHHIPINGEDLPAGTYLIRVLTRNQRLVQTIVLTR
jgi:hypothetical protein